VRFYYPAPGTAFGWIFNSFKKQTPFDAHRFVSFLFSDASMMRFVAALFVATLCRAHGSHCLMIIYALGMQMMRAHQGVVAWGDRGTFLGPFN
jgi:hypothetical protein